MSAAFQLACRDAGGTVVSLQLAPRRAGVAVGGWLSPSSPPPPPPGAACNLPVQRARAFPGRGKEGRHGSSPGFGGEAGGCPGVC